MLPHRRRFLENIGWGLTCAIPVVVLVLNRSNGPILIQNVLVLLEFAIGIPLLVIKCMREWNGDTTA